MSFRAVTGKPAALYLFDQVGNGVGCSLVIACLKHFEKLFYFLPGAVQGDHEDLFGEDRRVFEFGDCIFYGSALYLLFYQEKPHPP